MASDTQLLPLIEALKSNRPEAVDRLIEHSYERLRKLARKMLRANPAIRRWDETDDVLQNVLIRLTRALKSVKPDNPKAYFGLATKHIRHELVDLARHHYGPQGDAARHASDPGFLDADGRVAPLYEEADDAPGPSTLMQWSEFHEFVGKLPDEELEVFDLIFYQSLSHAEVASLVGISERTVKRRWREARLILSEMMEGGPKGL